MRFPSVYRYKGRWWHGGFNRDDGQTCRDLLREFVWILRHGEFHHDWNWPELVFGFGRDWYDGPIWHLNLGIWSASWNV